MKQSSPVIRWHSTTSGVRLRQLGHLRQLARSGPDPDHRAEREAERRRVHLGPVAADHAGLLEALQALGHRRRGEPDPAAELRQRQAGVCL